MVYWRSYLIMQYQVDSIRKTRLKHSFVFAILVLLYNHIHSNYIIGANLPVNLKLTENLRPCPLKVSDFFPPTH